MVSSLILGVFRIFYGAPDKSRESKVQNLNGKRKVEIIIENENTLKLHDFLYTLKKFLFFEKCNF